MDDTKYVNLASMLTDGKLVCLSVPQQMNAKDFDLLKRWFEQIQEADEYEEPEATKREDSQ